MAISTIVFDLGKTLIPFDLGRLEARLAGCGEAARQLALEHETGNLGRDRFCAALCGLTGLKQEELIPWWNSIFDPEWLIPPEWVRSLRPRYRVGILSNTNATHFEFLRPRLAELGELDFSVLSFEAGAAKPEAAIYEAVERAAGCPPGQIRYLDDVGEFVTAARARGWEAEQFTGWEALRGRPWVAATLPTTGKASGGEAEEGRPALDQDRDAGE